MANKKTKFLVLVIAASFLGNVEVHTSAFAQQYSIPVGIRDVAESWSHRQATNNDFVNSLMVLTQNGTIQISSNHGPPLATPKIPTWIRNVAGWWAGQEISDNDYVNMLQWTIDNNVLVIVEGQGSQKMSYTSKLIATFAPHLDDPLLSVLDKHNTDFGFSFRIKNLQTYDIQQRVLLAYSSDSINEAIQQAGVSTAQIQYIGYDNEPNNGNLSTPAAEATNPALSTNQIADVVHNAGFKYAITPSRDMLQSEYREVDWTKVDLIVIQMQKITGEETSYHSFLDPIVSYIKAKNPNTLVLVQVNPKFDSISHIASVIQGTSNIDGVSVVVIGSTSDDIDNLLTALGR